MSGDLILAKDNSTPYGPPSEEHGDAFYWRINGTRISTSLPLAIHQETSRTVKIHGVEVPSCERLLICGDVIRVLPTALSYWAKRSSGSPLFEDCGVQPARSDLQWSSTWCGSNPDRPRIAIATQTNDVAVYEERESDDKWEEIFKFNGCTGPPKAIGCSPDGTILATGGWNQRILVFSGDHDPSEGAVRDAPTLTELEPHTTINGIAVSAGSALERTVVSTSDQKDELSVFDLATQTLKVKIQAFASRSISGRGVGINPQNEDLVAVLSARSQLSVVDLREAKTVMTLGVDAGTFLCCEPSWSPDGSRVVFASQNSTAVAFDLAQPANPLHTFDMSKAGGGNIASARWHFSDSYVTVASDAGGLGLFPLDQRRMVKSAHKR